MTVDTNTLQTFSLQGIREDLTNMIYNISPTETPVMGRISKVKATSTKHEWQTDSLATADTTNAWVEGDAFAAQSRTPTSRLFNYTQISKKMIEVSATASAVNTAGRDREFVYQVAKAAKELRRDMEAIICSNQVAAAGNASTARKLCGLVPWYASNVLAGATAVNPSRDSQGNPTSTRTAGTLFYPNEANFKSVIQSIWSSGGRPKLAISGPFNKGQITQFSGPGNSYRTNPAGSKELVATINVYASDFGDVEIVPSHFSRENDIHFIDVDYLALAFLRDFKSEDIAKTGDADKGHVIVEYTLENRNEAAHGLLTDLKTS